MPLTERGAKVKRKMMENYGPEKGERVFYRYENKHPEMKLAHKKKKTVRDHVKAAA